MRDADTVPRLVRRLALLSLAILIPASRPSVAEDMLDVKKDGLTINDSKAYQGYTLIAPMNSTSTYLVDMNGKIVNEWKSDYTPALSAYFLPNGHLLRPGAERNGRRHGPGSGGRIQEFDWDGNLVWDFSFDQSFKNSKLRPHHDICPLPNGNILVICSDPKTKKECLDAGRRSEFVQNQLLADAIIEIKPMGKTGGKIVWKWHAWDHLVQDTDKAKPNYGDVSEHPELIDVNFTTNMMDRLLKDPKELAKLRSLGYVGGGTKPNDDKKNDGKTPETRPGPGRAGPPGMTGDWMHVNAVSYNAKLDQIMISVHEFSEVWIIDHSTTTKEAATHAGGKSGKGGDLLYRWGNPRAYRSGSNNDQRLFAQHCAHWISDGSPGAGHMLVFNNGGRRPDGNYSSADEVVLPVNNKGHYQKEEYVAYGPDKPIWRYGSSKNKNFFSMLISGAQRLPNGNTFICSGNQGVLFEVTPEGKIVWQFKYPGAGFGGPGGFGRSGSFTGLVPEFLDHMLDISKKQRDQIGKLQSHTDKTLDKILSKDQTQTLKKPSFFTRPPKVGEIIASDRVKSLKLDENQKKQLTDLQKKVDGQLQEILTDQQRKTLDDMEKRMANRGPFGFGPPPGRGPDERGPRPPRGGMGRGPGGPGGGGPGGIFRAYRYGTNYPGFKNKDLTPGKNLTDVVASAKGPQQRPVANGRGPAARNQRP